MTEPRPLPREACLERLLAGEISPVAFHRMVLGLSEEEVCARTGLGPRAVRRHETVTGFRKATVADLERYGRAFGVDLSAFFCVSRGGGGDRETFPSGLASRVPPGGEA